MAASSFHARTAVEMRGVKACLVSFIALRQTIPWRCAASRLVWYLSLFHGTPPNYPVISLPSRGGQSEVGEDLKRGGKGPHVFQGTSGVNSTPIGKCHERPLGQHHHAIFQREL